MVHFLPGVWDDPDDGAPNPVDGAPDDELAG